MHGMECFNDGQLKSSIYRNMVLYMFEIPFFLLVHSGKEAGPISWELPIFPDTHQKKRCIVNREWDAFPAFSSSPDCLKEGKVDATRPENGCLKWSDSHLLKEVRLIAPISHCCLRRHALLVFVHGLKSCCIMFKL